MPRSAFFTKETIAAAGLEIVRRQGISALTARALGKQLGCSLSPIFTVFKDMDEIHTAVRQAAADLFADYVKDVLDYQPAFKEYGMRLIRFAKQEQNIFQLFLENASFPIICTTKSAARLWAWLDALVSCPVWRGTRTRCHTQPGVRSRKHCI